MKRDYSIKKEIMLMMTEGRDKMKRRDLLIV